MDGNITLLPTPPTRNRTAETHDTPGRSDINVNFKITIEDNRTTCSNVPNPDLTVNFLGANVVMSNRDVEDDAPHLDPNAVNESSIYSLPATKQLCLSTRHQKYPENTDMTSSKHSISHSPFSPFSHHQASTSNTLHSTFPDSHDATAQTEHPTDTKGTPHPADNILPATVRFSDERTDAKEIINTDKTSDLHKSNITAHPSTPTLALVQNFEPPTDDTTTRVRNSEVRTDIKTNAQTLQTSLQRQHVITTHTPNKSTTKTILKTSVPLPTPVSPKSLTPFKNLRSPLAILPQPNNPLYKLHPSSTLAFAPLKVENIDDDPFINNIIKTEDFPNRCDSPFSLASSGNFSPLFSENDDDDYPINEGHSVTSNLTAFLNQTPSIYSNTPYRFDKMHMACPIDGTIDPIHHVPFLRNDQQGTMNSDTNPKASLLFYADSIIDDKVNGQITMHDLPACVDASATVASFCIHYLRANALTKTCIRDFTTDHLKHLFCELHPLLTTDISTLDNHEEVYTFKPSNILSIEPQTSSWIV